MNGIIRNRGYQTLEDAGDIGGEHESSFGVDDRTTVTRILAWIDALPQGQRFALTYLPVSGHHPYEAPRVPGSPSRPISIATAALHYGDAALGALMAGLRARGLDQTQSGFSTAITARRSVSIRATSATRSSYDETCASVRDRRPGRITGGTRLARGQPRRYRTDATDVAGIAAPQRIRDVRCCGLITRSPSSLPTIH
jgi:hypothetical protein